MRKIAILLVLLGAAVHVARAQHAGITAELRLDQDQFLPDEDLHVKLRIVNRSGQRLSLGDSDQWITFAIAGEHETIVPRLGEMPVKHPFTLLSGQSITLEFNPTPYFGFRHQGLYSMGASITVPQWKQAIPCKPVTFMISTGVPLPDFANVAVGVRLPSGVTNQAPDVRHYTLLKVSYLDEVKLYFRLTDDGGQTLRVFPLARIVDFGRPQAQIDGSNRLHVLVQTDARIFTYLVLDVNGNMLARQSHEYAESRPTLRSGDDGQIYVGGGHRVLLASDIPPPAESASTTATAKSE
ncbi:MAG TPA: hypothetical protein VGO59_05115 [Verrucomicrobiae bacterium]|jgi:hypothetical protein